MSYCRFGNTLSDLTDCYHNMDDKELSKREQRAKKYLIKVCRDIVDEYGEQ